MEDNINVEKSGKKNRFSLNGIKSRIVSVFSKKKGDVENIRLEDNEKENDVVVEEEIQSEKTEEKLHESFIDKENFAVKGTLSDLNNTFVTVSDDDIKKEEKIDYKKEFDDVKYLKNGNVAVLKKNCFVALGAKRRDFWGVINKKGERIIPQCYVEIRELENGCYACKGLKCNANYEDYNMEWTIYDKDGDIIVHSVEDYFFKDKDFYVKIDGFGPYANYWILNNQGKRLYHKKYFGNLNSENKLRDKKDGFIPVGFGHRSLECFSNDEKPELGLKILKHENGSIDENEDVYYGVGEFKDGVMLAKVAYTNRKGIFDENFNLIIPGVYNKIGEFKDGVALLCKYDKYNGKNEYSFKKSDGKSLGTKKVLGRWGMFETDITYDDAHEFKDGVAAVCKDGLWGLIDNTGRTVTNLEFSEISDFSNGKAEVEKRVGGKKIKFWINKKGEYLLGKNDTTEDFEKYEKKLGKDIINLLRLGKNYQAIEKIKEGIYAVKGYKGNVYRLIDINGNQINGTGFYSFKEFKNGMFKFQTKKDGNIFEWCLFDKDCKKVNDNAFLDIKEFEDGIAAVKVYGGNTYRRRFINEKGEFINDKTYFNVRDFENGKAKVREEKDSEKYYIDTNGNRID